MKVSEKREIRIPAAMGKKHGLEPGAKVVLIEQPSGILVKAAEATTRRRAVATLLQGGVIEGRTKDWLRLTPW